MPEAVVVQVGQCGNQIGSRFWEHVLREQAHYNPSAIYDASIATFFRNVNSKKKMRSASNRISRLEARGIMVDSEEGVLHEFGASPYSELFASQHQRLTESSGSGNNWAVGNRHYGPLFRERVLDALRREAEACDCLQALFLIHSLGGGTGSGLGTYIAGLLNLEYPKTYRFSLSLVPADPASGASDDDVVTAPYNAVLAANALRAAEIDVVLPISNGALTRILRRAGGREGKGAYDALNDAAAKLLVDVTSSMRFAGPLNVDINELSMNLVPTPLLNYVVGSQPPPVTRNFDSMIAGCFDDTSFLFDAGRERKRIYAACALLARGPMVSASDITRNIERLRPRMRFAWWNSGGWKTGITTPAALGSKDGASVLCLSNSSGIVSPLKHLRAKFLRLYSRRANLHHYTAHMEGSEFNSAVESLDETIAAYETLTAEIPSDIPTWEEMIYTAKSAQPLLDISFETRDE